MTREILKFRAWDGLNKKMSFWTMNDLCNHTNDSEKPSCLEEWMQFTGLLDKNGKEIYEGDIITYGFKTKDFNDLVLHTGKIFFNEYMFLVDGDKVNDEWHSINRIHYVEVIGNIYENPELLSN